MVGLDAIDLKILAALQGDGRMTNARLAETVHLSPSSCLERTRKLERSGIIQGYRAQLDLDRLGSSLTVFTEFTLEGHRSQNFARFETGAARIPEITEFHLISGGFDYLAKFSCRDMLHYQATIEAMLNSDLGIEKYFSYVVIKSPLKPRPAPIPKADPARS